MGFDAFLRKNFECKRCGECCKRLANSLTISKEKYQEWQNIEISSEFGELKASEFAEPIGNDEYNLFFNPNTGEKLDRCPFLDEKQGNLFCKIYRNKPERCNDFPFMEKLIDPTRENMCLSVKEIIDQNQEFLEEIKMMVFKYFVKNSIEKK